MGDNFDRWIDRVVARADELRNKGVLSIGVEGHTASFAPADPKPPVTVADDGDSDPEWVEPKSAWDDPASYPSGIVPTLEVDDLSREGRR